MGARAMTHANAANSATRFIVFLHFTKGCFGNKKSHEKVLPSGRDAFVAAFGLSFRELLRCAGLPARFMFQPACTLSAGALSRRLMQRAFDAETPGWVRQGRFQLASIFPGPSPHFYRNFQFDTSNN
jgi:hypothetical protein